MTTPREQAAAELRERIGATDPALAALIAGVKERFGARLQYVQVGDFTAGNRKTYDEKGINPAPPPDLRNKGESPSAYLRRLEAEHLEACAKQAGARAGRRATRGRTR